MKIAPLWSTCMASIGVARWPTPASSPASTFSQTRTDSVSPGLIVSGDTSPALTKSDPKPSVSAERDAAATPGVTVTMCMSYCGTLPACLISPAVGPDRGRVQPASITATQSDATSRLRDPPQPASIASPASFSPCFAAL